MESDHATEEQLREAALIVAKDLGISQADIRKRFDEADLYHKVAFTNGHAEVHGLWL